MTGAAYVSIISFSLFNGFFVVLLIYRRCQHKESFWSSIKACSAASSVWVLGLNVFAMCVMFSFIGARHFLNLFFVNN
jgi:hypothetical protein